jgi:hypothetical protein
LLGHGDRSCPSRIGEKIARRWCQSKCFIEFAIREEASIRGDDGAAELHDDAVIEIKPKNAVFGFTRRVRHFGATSFGVNHLSIITAADERRICEGHIVNPGLDDLRSVFDD